MIGYVHRHYDFNSSNLNSDVKRGRGRIEDVKKLSVGTFHGVGRLKSKQLLLYYFMLWELYWGEERPPSSAIAYVYWLEFAISDKEYPFVTGAKAWSGKKSENPLIKQTFHKKNCCTSLVIHFLGGRKTWKKKVILGRVRKIYFPIHTMGCMGLSVSGN